MHTLTADLRLAIRQLRARPAISGVAVLALAIGLGINTVAFSTVNAFLFRPRAGFDVSWPENDRQRRQVEPARQLGDGLGAPRL